MAKPITLEIAPRDPRQELINRLENAPVEHAEAILAGYEVLQVLNDSHVLEMIRGFLGPGSKVIDVVTDAANQPEVIRGIRNLVIIAEMLGNFDPEFVKDIADAFPEALQLSKAEAPDSHWFWTLQRQLRHKDTRRGLRLVNNLLEIVGRNLVRGTPSNSK
jgi:uncharacterized protein YjgD (DUF1641 family)